MTLNIASAIKTASQPSKYRWRYRCSECGCDWVQGGVPKSEVCCGQIVEAEDNPAYERPSMMTLRAAE